MGRRFLPAMVFLALLGCVVPARAQETRPADGAAEPGRAHVATPDDTDAPAAAQAPADDAVAEVEVSAPVVDAEAVEDAATQPVDVETAAPAAAPLPTGQELFDAFASRIAVVQYSANVPQQQGGVRTAHQLGVVVGEDGLVMLPGHVQAMNLKPYNFRVTFDGDQHDASLLRHEGDLNVSYVRVEPPAEEDEDAAPPAFAAVAFSEPVELEVGEAVWVFGLLPEQTGYALQLRRRRVTAILEEPSRVYVLDGTPNPADAGGLVLTLAGHPAGVVGYELTRQQGGEIYTRHSLPLIFPAEQLAANIALPREEEAPTTEQAWFGVMIQPLRDDFKEYFGLKDETGCIVSNVVRDSPAERAGLQRGDILVEFRGEPVDVPNDLAVLSFTRSIRDLPIGTSIPLKYLRDGAVHETAAELAPIPKTAAKAETIQQPAWGLRVRELTQDVVYLLNLPPDIAGVVVDAVEPGGPAQAAGLRPGDIIRELNSTPVESLADYGDATDQLAGMMSEKIVLFVQRAQRTGFVTLEPDWRLPARDDG